MVTIAANDRDTGDFGTAGIVYELAGSGADLFSADPVTGTISVAPCPTPGKYFSQNIFPYLQIFFQALASVWTTSRRGLTFSRSLPRTMAAWARRVW